MTKESLFAFAPIFDVCCKIKCILVIVLRMTMVVGFESHPTCVFLSHDSKYCVQSGSREETFGKCQRPVFSENLGPIGHRSCEKTMKEKHHCCILDVYVSSSGYSVFLIFKNTGCWSSCVCIIMNNQKWNEMNGMKNTYLRECFIVLKVFWLLYTYLSNQRIFEDHVMNTLCYCKEIEMDTSER